MPLFLVRATIFSCRFFSIHRCPFWVDFTNICIFFLLYNNAYVIKMSTSAAFWDKIFAWFLYSWTYFLMTASVFLGSIFDRYWLLYFLFYCSYPQWHVPTTFFMASYPRSRGPCMTRHPKWSCESPFKHINLIGDTN